MRALCVLTLSLKTGRVREPGQFRVYGRDSSRLGRAFISMSTRGPLLQRAFTHIRTYPCAGASKYGRREHAQSVYFKRTVLNEMFLVHR